MSDFVMSQFTAAAGAVLFGMLALFPSLMVRKKNRGLGGFCADFAGIAGVGGLFLLSSHLFASGTVNLYCSVCFAVGLVAARAAFRRIRPFLLRVFAPAFTAAAKLKEQGEEKLRETVARRETRRAAAREIRIAKRAASTMRRKEKSAARNRRRREKNADADGNA